MSEVEIYRGYKIFKRQVEGQIYKPTGQPGVKGTFEAAFMEEFYVPELPQIGARTSLETLKISIDYEIDKAEAIERVMKYSHVVPSWFIRRYGNIEAKKLQEELDKKKPIKGK